MPGVDCRLLQPHQVHLNCLEEILEATRYLAWLGAQPGGATQIENVQRLLELVRQYDSWSARGLNRFLEYVRLVAGEGEGPEPATSSQTDAVQLMTIHASKGLEFPYTVISGIGDLNDTEEEKQRSARLLYVGMTRAQQALLLTSSKQNSFTRQLCQL